MKGDRIPNTHTLVRHCPSTKLQFDDDANPVAPTYEAFIPDDEGVSVNWLEFFGGTREECLRQTRGVLATTRTIRASHRLAIISVLAVLGVAQRRARTIWAEHDPIGPPRANPAHSLIVGLIGDKPLPLDEIAIMEELALACSLEMCS
jgi:hypothetical protein